MLKSLFSRKSAARQQDPTIPEDQRVYAIGDVHGRRDLLEQLLAQIDADDAARGAANTIVIFLGDLVDRGPDSRGVIDLAMAYHARRPGTRFLMGNHEEVYLAAAAGSESATRFFYRIGGKETILSYDISQAEVDALDMASLAQRLGSLFGPDHIAFVRGFEDQIVIGDYLFVHAGIRPGVPLAEQKPKDLRWIRDEFVSYEPPHDKIIVYGHTINEDVVEKPNRIGIDTGAYYSEKLTALCLEGGKRWFLDTAK